ncbi:hypothetical protein L21TH_1531 [Caldisalinibacter kiritimatiensis]|uniref:Uncharacterized protein n=1 Tax=Caldisalinibacter kiritimatiensis TaxID=1304284 RepID=R1CNZ4_9FIRM|nr:hypothetical protein L21TH_1531 [Caldisalinibacter kiritimatiensis]
MRNVKLKCKIKGLEKTGSNMRAVNLKYKREVILIENFC